MIVPAYRPQNFDALLASLEANAGAGAEVIVVDDGSGPQFAPVFGQLTERGIRVIRHAQNRRQGAARNTGLAQATGAWVKFLDADDQLDEGHLCALLAAAQAGPPRAIPFASTRHVFPGGGTLVNDVWRDLPSDSNVQLAQLLRAPFLSHCGALFPRALLTELGGYDESLVTDEDGDLLLRVLHQGYYFLPVQGVYYLYTHNKSGPRVSADDDISKMQARLRTCEKAMERFGGPIPAEVAEAVAQRMDRIAMTYWSSHPSEARALLSRARRLAPDYSPDMRPLLLALRQIGGPSLALAAQKIYRRLRGRPKGGTQA